MKSRFFSLLALLGVFCLVAAAADVSGTYKGEMQGRGGAAQPVTITLKADGSALTGNVANARGETPITNGKVDGEKVSFDVVRKMQDNEITMKYKGKLDGDTLKLTQTVNFNGNERSTDISLKKQ